MTTINIQLLESLDSEILQNMTEREKIANKLSDEITKKIIQNSDNYINEPAKVMSLLRLASAMNYQELSNFIMSYSHYDINKLNKIFEKANIYKNNEDVNVTLKKAEILQKVALIKILFSEKNIHEINSLIKNKI